MAVTQTCIFPAPTHPPSETRRAALALVSEGWECVSRFFEVVETSSVRFVWMTGMVGHPLQVLRARWLPGQGARDSVVLATQTDEDYLHLRYRRRWWKLGGCNMATSPKLGVVGLDGGVSAIPACTWRTVRWCLPTWGSTRA